MKNKRILAMTVLMALLSSVAQAHTHLQKAMPADNSVLSSPPSELMLHFSEETRLTALSIEREGSGESTNVGTLPKEAAQALTVPMKPVSPGKYLIKWRAVGADKHVMSGTLHFTVTGK
jgi:methionine-rich copper-binding protein CopC